MISPPRPRRLMIFMPVYRTGKTIEAVLRRLPPEVVENCTEIVACDNASNDGSLEQIRRCRLALGLESKLTILANERNVGFGGNIKRGVEHAIRNDFDIMAVLHSDGQYPPERLSELIAPIEDDSADAVSGSRFLGDPLAGGMPRWRYFGNRTLTTVQNLAIGLALSEWHSGFRAYRVSALAAVPWQRCQDGYEWTVDILLYLLEHRFRIAEIEIPTHYGEESTSPSFLRTLTYGAGTLGLALLYLLRRLGFSNRYAPPR